VANKVSKLHNQRPRKEQSKQVLINKENAKAWVANVFLANNCILLETQKNYCGGINKKFRGSC
jgi:hypothetical protein